MFLSSLLTDFISFCVGWFATWSGPSWLIRRTIAWYVRSYQLNMDEASKTLDQYPTLGQLFVRELKSEARPINHGTCAPVDGVLRDCGLVSEGMIFQVKNQLTDVAELLKSREIAKRFERGTYWNFYLSPRDCHHVFSPIDGKVIEIEKIAGALFPVNDLAVKWIPKLFLRNARLVTYLETERGLVAVVMVGALNVGKMESVFEDSGSGLIQTDRQVRAGDRLGTFHLGSSVVLLTEWPCTPIDETPKQVRYGSPLKGL